MRMRTNGGETSRSAIFVEQYAHDPDRLYKYQLHNVKTLNTGDRGDTNVTCNVPSRNSRRR